MFDKILVPTDGTPGSKRAIRTALELATVHDAQVYAVSVVGDSSFAQTPRGERVDRANRALEDAREEAADVDVPFRAELLEGTVIDQLLQYMDKHGIDLVVMGTHGRKGIDRFVAGSVTERTVREADVPVLTVSLDGAKGATKVTSADQAREIARDALAEREYEDVELDPGAYDERTAFVIQARADGKRVNLHVEKATGEAHLVPIGDA